MRYALAALTAVITLAAYTAMTRRAYLRGTETSFAGWFLVGSWAVGLITAGTWHLLGVFGT